MAGISCRKNTYHRNGGIMNAADAIEFMLAGATAVQVGTAIFKDPFIPLQIIDGIENYMKRHGLNSINDIVGNLTS
jgi:dihydroorotate dehydrogenase (NAD+) catalytic subunit